MKKANIHSVEKTIAGTLLVIGIIALYSSYNMSLDAPVNDNSLLLMSILSLAGVVMTAVGGIWGSILLILEAYHISKD